MTDPYLRRLLRDLSSSFLVVDFHLTGLVVSDQDDTYEGADYGSMRQVQRCGSACSIPLMTVIDCSRIVLLFGDEFVCAWRPRWKSTQCALSAHHPS